MPARARPDHPHNRCRQHPLPGAVLGNAQHRIGLERHELSGLAKDVGSTAVLLSFAVLVVIWGFLLFG